MFETAENARLAVTAETQKALRNSFIKLAKDMDDKAKALEGKDNISSIMKKSYLEDFSKDLKQQSHGIFNSLKAKIVDNASEVSWAVIDDMDAWFKKAGINMGTAMHHIPVQAVQNVANGKLYGSDWTLSKAIWGCEAKVHKDINTVVANGIAANKSAFDIAKDLEKYVDPNAKKDWAWNKVYPGTSKRVDYNAQRLSRTMVNHAYQQSTVQSCQANPFVTGVEWISACTHRTCAQCLERHGKIFQKGDVPLDHPNGLCTLAAYFEKDMNQIANELANWANGKSNEELDEWNANLHGGTLEKTTVFSNLQNKYLGKYGFSPDNMPKDFAEWSHKLNSDDKSELLAIKNMNQAEHPFQELNKWYDKMLASENSFHTELEFKEYAKAEQKKIYGLKGKGKKSSGLSGFDEDAYSDARKDKAFWTSDMREVDNKFRAQTGKIWQGASIEEREGGFYYTAGSGHMNRPLRDGKEWDYEFHTGRSHINGLTSMIDKSPLQQDTWLQRGVSTEGSSCFLHVPERLLEYPVDNLEEIKSSILGKVLTDEGFISCGAAKGTGFSESVIYNIYCPKGTKGLYAEPFSNYGRGSKLNWDGIAPQTDFGTELEIILQRGGSYRVVKVEASGYQTYVDLEVVAQDPLAEGKMHIT